jgi:sirohydrochlorin ferrochelatase
MMPTLVACSHGTNSPAGRAAISDLVERVRRLLPETRVLEAFVDVQEPSVDDVLADCAPENPPVVVPLLLSTGYHTQVDIARAVAAHPGRAVAAPALGPHELLVEVLESRLAQVGVAPSDAVVLAAAGSSDPAAEVDVRAMAELLAERLGTPVDVGFAAGAGPRIDATVAAARARGAARVVVASYVLAPGYFADVIARGGADVATAPLAPDDRLAAIIAERYAAAAAQLGALTTVG